MLKRDLPWAGKDDGAPAQNFAGSADERGIRARGDKAVTCLDLDAKR